MLHITLLFMDRLNKTGSGIFVFFNAFVALKASIFFLRIIAK